MSAATEPVDLVDPAAASRPSLVYATFALVLPKEFQYEEAVLFDANTWHSEGGRQGVEFRVLAGTGDRAAVNVPILASRAIYRVELREIPEAQFASAEEAREPATDDDITNAGWPQICFELMLMLPEGTPLQLVWQERSPKLRIFTDFEVDPVTHDLLLILFVQLTESERDLALTGTEFDDFRRGIQNEGVLGACTLPEFLDPDSRDLASPGPSLTTPQPQLVDVFGDLDDLNGPVGPWVDE